MQTPGAPSRPVCTGSTCMHADDDPDPQTLPGDSSPSTHSAPLASPCWPPQEDRKEDQMTSLLVLPAPPTPTLP